MAVLEAMAAGLCVVVTPVGGVPDVVGDCAVEVAVDDGVGLAAALRQVVGDRELRVRLGRAGRDRVEQLFDLDQVWRRVDEIYRETAR
jgi:glycosyltransferase involved in cell wall biosynthesis